MNKSRVNNFVRQDSSYETKLYKILNNIIGVRIEAEQENKGVEQNKIIEKIQLKIKTTIIEKDIENANFKIETNQKLIDENIHESNQTPNFGDKVYK